MAAVAPAGIPVMRTLMPRAVGSKRSSRHIHQNGADNEHTERGVAVSDVLGRVNDDGRGHILGDHAQQAQIDGDQAGVGEDFFGDYFFIDRSIGDKISSAE